MVGACTADLLTFVMRRDFGWEAEHLIFNNVAEFAEKTAEELASYSFQLVQLPMRSISHEHHWLSTAMEDPATAQAYFETCCDRMLHMLDSALTYSRQSGLLTFVCNFMTPQQNMLGRFMPRYELSNPVYFVEQLNKTLVDALSGLRNVHLLDLDQICAGRGRMYIQDDSVWALSHGSFLTDFDSHHDGSRITPAERIYDFYTLQTLEAMHAIIHEAEAMYRTARGIDAVKLVIIDLDDTLWRGVFAEGGVDTQEGWPLGFTEALNFLKRRGVVLAIVSKNDEALIRENWAKLTWGLLPFESFAVHRINWRSKAQNIAEVIAEVNVLPESVVFIDDNPVERAAVAQAFPDIRVLGADIYYLKRVLLWAPELQVASISSESARRTEMIRAQAERGQERARMSRTDFLAALDLNVEAFRISSGADLRSARAFELLNKTNQFNTTGKRWTEAEWTALFARGGVAYAFEVADRFTPYGLTCVALVEGGVILQFVMSCRVIGLDVEFRALETIYRDLATAGARSVTGVTEATEKNGLSQDFYAKAGFDADGEVWTRPLSEAEVAPEGAAASAPASSPIGEDPRAETSVVAQSARPPWMRLFGSKGMRPPRGRRAELQPLGSRTGAGEA